MDICVCVCVCNGVCICLSVVNDPQIYFTNKKKST